MEFGIQLYETFPNTNPDVPNPLHHLNDVKVNFSSITIYTILIC
jgi:hypothetical protein